MRPKPIELFAFYHLGLDTDGTYRFRNLADCARRWNTDGQTIQRWLQEAHIDAETAKTVPVNLSRWHVDAQFVARDRVAALVQDAWQDYRRGLQQRSPGRFHFDVDYDDLWGDAALAAHRAVADQDAGAGPAYGSSKTGGASRADGASTAGGRDPAGEGGPAA